MAIAKRSQVVQLIGTIIKENKKRTKEQQFAIFAETLTKPEFASYAAFCFRQTFSLEYSTSHDAVIPVTSAELGRRAKRKAARQAESEAQADAISAVIVANVYGLDMMTPLGKRLRHCNGIECKKLGQAAGFYAKIATMVPADKTVASVLSEADVQSVARETTSRKKSSAPPPNPRRPTAH